MARRVLLLLLSGAAILVGSGQAQAAVPLSPCGKTSGLECTTVTVPLDRTGMVPGSIGLHVEVLPSDGTPRGVMFLIAGGPGQGSARSFDLSDPDSAEFMQFLFPGYTLVAFDNRGTGASGLINCPRLQTVVPQSAEEDAQLAAECASSIGPRRAFYATRDHAEDLEAVRQALGLGKVALYGVSYGTKLALAYALAHPDDVSRLVLDSVVPTALPDPFETNVLREMPKTLAALCAGGRCRAATANFPADVVALANQLEAKPVVGKILSVGGRTKAVHLNGEDLLSMVVDTDLSPGLAAELPAAVHAARTGYMRPLLRLMDLDVKSSKLTARDLSFGLYAATTCADGNFPWVPTTAISERSALLDSAVAKLPAGSFGPFGNWASRLGTAVFCKLWPSPAGGAPLGPGPFPDVPMLAISGGLDFRTPTASAVAVASQFPQGHVLVVPGVGHSVLGTDLSLCSQQALRNWLSGGSVRASCPRVPSMVSFVGVFPRRARAVPSSTLSVASRAVHEAEASWLEALSATAKLQPAGLYGGRLTLTSDGFKLARYSIAPGVQVSGNLRLRAGGPPFTFKGTVKVSGAAAAKGTLRVSGNAVAGTLAGQRVSGRL